MVSSVMNTTSIRSLFFAAFVAAAIPSCAPAATTSPRHLITITDVDRAALVRHYTYLAQINECYLLIFSFPPGAYPAAQAYFAGAASAYAAMANELMNDPDIVIIATDRTPVAAPQEMGPPSSVGPSKNRVTLTFNAH